MARPLLLHLGMHGTRVEVMRNGTIRWRRSLSMAVTGALVLIFVLLPSLLLVLGIVGRPMLEVLIVATALPVLLLVGGR
jgi:hypothetical protein